MIDGADAREPRMTGDELLRTLEQRGVRLWTDQHRLRFDAPRGVLTEPLRQQLAACKAEIIGLLGARLPGEEAGFPLATMQQAYWVGQRGALPLSTPARYYLELALRRIPVPIIERALHRLIARHELLRAVIDPSGQHRVLAEVPELALPTHSVEAATARQARSAIRDRMIARERRTDLWPAFDLELSVTSDRLWLHLDVALWLVDGESLRVLLHELLTLCADPEAVLPAPGMTYRQYVAAQIARRQEPAYARAWQYWQARLDRFPGAPPLPLACTPDSLGQPRFLRRCITLAPDQVAALGRHARAARVSQTLALCAAYAQVLAVWSRSKRFALTVLHSDRSAHLPGAARLVGNLGKTVLLEVDWTEPGSFATRARALQRQLWRDLEHSDVSGVDVGRELARGRGQVGSAGFPVTFTGVPPLVPAPAEDPRGRLDASLDHERCHLRVPQVYLDHQICEGPHGELTLSWDHVDGLFPPGLVDEMFDAYVALVIRLCDDAATWEARTPRVRPRPPAAPVPPAEPVGLLHEGFARQVARQPDRLAVITPHRQLTYAELDRRAWRLADQLASHDVHPGALVAVVMDKGWEQVVAVLGILRAGAAYVPIDPGLPAARRALLLDECGATLLVTQPGLEAALDWPAQVRRLRVEPDDPGDAPPRAGPPAQRDHDLAYVIFTSGTTGKPKGVMIDHRGARNTNDDINRRFGVGPDDRVFGISSLSFDLSVYDIFGTLAAGAALVLPDAARAKDPAHWLSLVHEHRVTLWSSVPALVQLLEESARSARRGLAPLRLVLMSGDWIPLGLPTSLRALAPELRVVSLGGATEVSIWSVVYDIGEVAPHWRSIPYGQALAHQSIHVLDEALDECAPHVAGDIYLGGIGLAHGYLGDTARTEAAFVRHPVTGQRLYRTGDLGRQLPDGNVELLGREDHQVKIQGHRIECAEVEAALLAAGDLAAAVVSVAADPQGARRLVAHVVPRTGGADLAVPALLEQLRQTLPGYMVPSTIVPLAALPLTANGKVDRARLPAPVFVPPRAQHAPRPPRDELDRQLIALWRELLEAPVLGIDDDFFDLGGTSFTGMRMMARLGARFGTALPLAALLQQPTVAQLADRLCGGGASTAPGALVRLGPGDARPPVFCIHPVGGHVLCYRELARSLPAGTAVLGLQAPALLGGEVFRDLEAMAAGYTQLLRREQPHGPYHLGGWSLGGVVAYEIARQLAAAGERIELLFLIDSGFPPLRRPAAPPSDAAWMAAFVRDILAVAGHATPAIPEPRPALGVAALADEALAVLHERGVPFGSRDELVRSFEIFRAHLRALHAHTPRGYAGSPLVFCAGADPTAAEQGRAWREVAPAAQVVSLDADHYTIVTGEAVRRIARELEARLPRQDARAELPCP